MIEFTIERQKITDSTSSNGNLLYHRNDVVYSIKAHGCLEYRKITELIEKYCEAYTVPSDDYEYEKVLDKKFIDMPFDFHCSCERYGYILSKIGYELYLVGGNIHRYRQVNRFLTDTYVGIEESLKHLLIMDGKSFKTK